MSLFHQSCQGQEKYPLENRGWAVGSGEGVGRGEPVSSLYYDQNDDSGSSFIRQGDVGKSYLQLCLWTADEKLLKTVSPLVF